MGKCNKNRLKENPQSAKAATHIIFRQDNFPHTKELFVQNKVFNVYQ